jgi:type VII secretion protein EccB
MSDELHVNTGKRALRHGLGLPLATKIQVNGHFFFGRRAVLAMTRRRVHMQTEPGRRQSASLAAGATITVVLCLGALFWSLLHPASSAGDAKILADQHSGALYVRVGDKLYPALNLASARLVANEPANPVRVRRSEIDARPRGPLVGIAGAPNGMNATAPDKSSWLVCDQVTKAYGPGAPEPVTVTVIDGAPDLGTRRQVLGDKDALLRRYGAQLWLIRGERRSLVDREARPVLLAMGISEADLAGARPMSRALFDAIPVGAPLTVPAIPDSGQPARFAGAPGPIGSVVLTPQVGGQMRYSLVLADGVQTVSPIVTQVLQNAGASAQTIPGPALAKLPVVNSGVDISAFPASPPHLLDSQTFSAACWNWTKVTNESVAATSVIAGPTTPVSDSGTDKTVELVKADKSGWQADRVYFGPDSTNFAISTGNEPASAATESLWWVSESGVRFGVPTDTDTLKALGLTTRPSPTPWSVLRLLVPGPALSRADALLRHNTLPIDSNPGELEIPK